MQKVVLPLLDLHQVMSGELLLMLLPMVPRTLMVTRDMDPMATVVGTVTLLKMVMLAPVPVPAAAQLLIDYHLHRHHLVPAIDFRFR